MKKDEGDWYGKRPPPIDTARGRVDLIGWGMAGVPPGRDIHISPKPGSRSRRAYGLLALASFTLAVGAALPPHDWAFVATGIVAGLACLAVWATGCR